MLNVNRCDIELVSIEDFLFCDLGSIPSYFVFLIFDFYFVFS